MDNVRKPFQGVGNILHFNWHYYVWLCLTMAIAFAFSLWFYPQISAFILAVCTIAVLTSIVSIIVSYYIYDRSSLYSLNWLDGPIHTQPTVLLNIHAGFDETSCILKNKYSDSQLKVFDFYDSERHTELSIKRARTAYPGYPGTIAIQTTSIPVEDKSADLVCLFLAAHEIRIDEERISFFREINRSLSAKGKLVVTEHLRDLPNFLAYNIGFFHFHSRSTWNKTFESSGFVICEELKITPFISSFILKKNDTTS